MLASFELTVTEFNKYKKNWRKQKLKNWNEKNYWLEFDNKFLIQSSINNNYFSKYLHFLVAELPQLYININIFTNHH